MKIADGTVYFAMAKANGNTDKAFPAVKKFKADNRKPAGGSGISDYRPRCDVCGRYGVVRYTVPNRLRAHCQGGVGVCGQSIASCILRRFR